MSKNTNLSFLTDYITADITNGRIGINNASPTVAFDVSGATKISGVLTLTSTISNGTYAYTLPSATGTLALTSAISGTTNYVPKFTSSTGIGNSIIFDNGTNVGIGTSSPDTNLTVYGANVSTANASAIINVYTTIGYGANVGGSIGLGGYYNTTSNITYANLHGKKENGTLDDSNGYFAVSVRNSSAGTVERMRITSGGNVALPNNSGNAGSGQVTFTNGNGVTWGLMHATSFNIFVFIYNGGYVAQINPSSGAYTALSDVNKKKDIQLSTIGLNEVLQLKPSTFKFKSDETEVEQLGFIAQEVKDIIPQAYSETGEGDDKFIGLTEMPIIAALTKAIQELSTEINLLKQK